jgi:Ca2+-binding EF-hand superfamily protein
LGLAESTEKVEEIIKKVDEDGEIEFQEFLKIIKSPDQDQNSQMITNFFKQMSTGQLGDKNLDFNVIVANIRRTHMVKAIIEKDTIEGQEGTRILNNVKR